MAFSHFAWAHLQKYCWTGKWLQVTGATANNQVPLKYHLATQSEPDAEKAFI